MEGKKQSQNQKPKGFFPLLQLSSRKHKSEDPTINKISASSKEGAVTSIQAHHDPKQVKLPPILNGFDYKFAKIQQIKKMKAIIDEQIQLRKQKLAKIVLEIRSLKNQNKETQQYEQLEIKKLKSILSNLNSNLNNALKTVLSLQNLQTVSQIQSQIKQAQQKIQKRKNEISNENFKLEKDLQRLENERQEINIQIDILNKRASEQSRLMFKFMSPFD